MSLRTAKIQLLQLLNDRTPIDQFDVTGPFDFTNEITSLDEIRRVALDARPDLKAAMQSVDKARTDASAGVCQRIDGSDVQRVVDAQPFVQQSV